MRKKTLRIRIFASADRPPSLEAIARTKAFADRHGCRFKALMVEREPERADEYDVKVVPTTVFEIAEGDYLDEVLRYTGLKTQREMAPFLARARRKLERMLKTS